MQRINQLLIIQKQKIKKALKISDRPFIELVASHLLDVFSYLVFMFVIIAIMAGLILFPVNSQADATKIFQYSMIIYYSITVFSFALCFVVSKKIVPTIEKFDSVTKYNFLMIRPMALGISALILIIILFLLPFIFFENSISPIVGELLIWKVMYFSMSFIVGLFGIAFGFIMFLQIDDEREIALNFALFEDFETVGECYNPQVGISQSKARVLKTLMKRIVCQIEDIVNEPLDICKDFPTQFYHPFTTISLTAILGNAEKNNKAKAWVTELGKIVMEKRISDSAKAKFVLEHLEKVENDHNLDDFRKIQDTFGFAYSFERSRKNLSKTGERVIVAVSGIVTIILFIKTLFSF